ncbi:hypothetical protein KFE25_003103 [Diacronema lutheri]|uniref:Uncharacterized protein n=1 Tax=Diacronema lutheri TaxID=2081491 RepID=A0A8J5X3N1_DIALT|nr:hypothetical protein KFE25_003103 [Diacronema lutheri]
MGGEELGARPGGGKNPLPFSSGGGFAGISGQAFYKRWLYQPAVYPLFATMGLATGVFIYALAREFGTNPKYTIMKGRRTSDHVKPTPAEGERFVGNRLIPHTKTAFNLFPFNFRPITDLKRFEGGNCE